MGDFVIIDEIDTGIHDLLVCEILESIGDINGQLIITTHNTLLLEKINSEHAFILSVDREGYKNITNVKKIGYRVQKNNNMKLRYLSCLYEGIPLTSYFDLNEISENLYDKIEED